MGLFILGVLVVVCGAIFVAIIASEETWLFWNCFCTGVCLICILSGLYIGYHSYDWWCDTEIFTHVSNTYEPDVVNGAHLLTVASNEIDSIYVHIIQDGALVEIKCPIDNTCIHMTDEPRVIVTTPKLSKWWYVIFASPARARNTNYDIYLTASDYTAVVDKLTSFD